MYREKSTEFELQTLILLLDQSPSFSSSHFFWPQMKLAIPVSQGCEGHELRLFVGHPAECLTLTGTPKQPLDFTQVR